MTPQGKAKELVDKMYNTPHCGIEHFPSKHYCDCSEMNFFQAKQCALIAVDECLVAVESDWGFMQRRIEFWQQVKKEIEKL